MTSPTSQAQPPTSPQPSAPAPPRQPPVASTPPPKPEPIRAKELGTKTAARFPDVRVDYMREKRLKMTTGPSNIRDVASFVRDELGFDHISAVSGVDWIAKNEFEVVYFVGSVSKPGFEDFVICLAERVARDNPVVPTLIEVWRGVEYHEREAHEMFGINFQGHPNLNHILLPEDWNDLPPLRKDYISPGR